MYAKMPPAIAIAQQHVHSAKRSAQCQSRRNDPEDPDAWEPRLWAELDTSLSNEADESPEEPPSPDDDKELDAKEPELFHVPELIEIDIPMSHAV
jgi:hypothetical protein